MRTPYLPLLVAACLPVAGCGHDAKKAGTTASVTAPPATTTASPAATATGPDAAIRSYFGALARRDGAKACGLLTKDAQRKAIATVGASRKRSFKSCGQALRAAVAARSDASLQAGRLTITKSTVHGDSAKVAVEGAGSDFDLRRTGGRWQIVGPIG